MAARKRARKRGEKKQPGVSRAVLNRTKAMVKETQQAKKELELHLKKLQSFLDRLMTHIHN